MKYTSAEAAKLLRKLNDDYNAAMTMEAQSCSFLASLGEDVDSVRPDYSFSGTQAALDEIGEKIIRVKHAINVFNATTQVPGFGMTIDQILVLIPQLSRQKNKLDDMRCVLPKKRENMAGFGKTSAVIDYRYANYDVAQAQAEYERVSERLAKAQTALDVINNSAVMEIDI